MNFKPKEKSPLIESYTIHRNTGTSASTVEVKITSGRLQGKSARVITTRPSAAYFNSSSREKILA